MPLNKKDRKSVVKALRSGDYKQGRLNLATQHGRTCRYCVLGVVADLLLDTDWLRDTEEDETWHLKRRFTSSLPPTMAEKVGLSMDEQEEAFTRNDRGLSFERLANMIEAEELL